MATAQYVSLAIKNLKFVLLTCVQPFLATKGSTVLEKKEIETQVSKLCSATLTQKCNRIVLSFYHMLVDLSFSMVLVYALLHAVVAVLVLYRSHRSTSMKTESWHSMVGSTISVCAKTSSPVCSGQRFERVSSSSSKLQDSKMN